MSNDMQYKALIVHPDGAMSVQKVSFGDIGLAVGGYVEVINGGEDGCLALVNEDGISLSLPPNRAATAALDALGFPAHILFGTVVFVNDGGEDFASIDDEYTEIIEKAVNKWKESQK